MDQLPKTQEEIALERELAEGRAETARARRDIEEATKALAEIQKKKTQPIKSNKKEKPPKPDHSRLTMAEQLAVAQKILEEKRATAIQQSPVPTPPTPSTPASPTHIPPPPVMPVTPAPPAAAPRAEAAPAPQSPEEIAVAEEINNLSPEEREAVAKNFHNIGFRFEKRKSELFAKTFGKILKTSKDKQSRTARLCQALKNTFTDDAKSAEQKAKDMAKGKGSWRMELQNPALIFGSMLRTVRIITDLTGKSFVSPLRYVMMVSKGVTRLAKSGKEARLMNEEEVIEKTRIQDADAAYEEAMRVYDAAREKTRNSGGNVSAEVLKSAYLEEIPKNIQERLKNPSTGNKFIQKIVRWDVENTISRLNKSIQKIEKDKKLSLDEKERRVEALLRRQEVNLKDWDRIITQYGTVDGWAMAGRYIETAGKATTAAVTVETLVLSVEKLWEITSNALVSHNIHPLEATGKFAKHLFSKDNKLETNQSYPGNRGEDLNLPFSPESAISHFTSETITFDNGKGGIQGILDLKTQLHAQFPDISKAPLEVQEFLNEDATKEAIKFGFYNPDNPEESAQILKGSTFGFKDGKLIFHDARTGEDIEKYTGHKMFDSDVNAKTPGVGTPESSNPTTAEYFKQRGSELFKTKPLSEFSPTETQETLSSKEINNLNLGNVPETQNAEEILRAKIEADIDAASNSTDGWQQPQQYGPSHYYGGRGGRNIFFDSRRGSRFFGRDNPGGRNTVFGNNRGNGHAVDRGGQAVERGHGATARGHSNSRGLTETRGWRNWGRGVRFYSNNYVRNYHGFINSEGLPHFPQLSETENLTLNSHPEFIDDHLNPKLSLEAYEIHKFNLRHLFPGNEIDNWREIRNMKASEVLGNSSYEHNSAYSPTINYLHKLMEMAHIKKPSGGTLFHRKAETIEELITRALKETAKRGDLGKTLER